MAINYDPNNSGRNVALLPSVNYNYKYPKGLNLSPGSKVSNNVIKFVLDAARESYNHMSGRHSAWNRMDKNLTAYVPLSETEKEIVADDVRKPVSVVVPQSFAILETLLAYWVAAFLDDPIFRYEGRSPEDTLGAILLEKVIGHQVNRSKMALNLYYQARDAYVYGFGSVHPRWTVEMGWATRAKKSGFWSGLQNAFVPVGTERMKEEVVLYEGNELLNIDPYCYLPDPAAPIDQPQKGSFVGWVRRTNVPTLLREEVESQDFVNAKYLNHVDGTTNLIGKSDPSGRGDRFSDAYPWAISSQACDVIYMYADIIPKNLELGSSEYPEKWFFAIGADSIVLAAMPMGLDHNKFPVGVISPTADGYSTAPVSKIETVNGLQTVLDWLYSSHVANVRKAINDMIVVDPYMVNMKDLRDPNPGKIIRLRKSAWGRGVKGGVEQLKVQDVTAQHLSEAPFVMHTMNEASGSVDVLRGSRRRTSERIAATESANEKQGALSRVMKDGRLASMQGYQDIAYMLASHTQQLMDEDTYVKTVGEWEEVLKNDYGITEGKHKVSPFDLMIDYDVIMKDGSVADSGSAGIWAEIFRTVSSEKTLAGTFDIVRIFNQVARAAGAKNIHEFVLKGGRMRHQVLADEMVESEVSKGNLISVDEAAR